MAGISVTRDDVVAVTGTPLDLDRFAALDRLTRTVLSAEYTGTIDLAEGRRARVLDAVYLSAIVRLATNPGGARSIGLGSANVTLAGSDESLTGAFSLTPEERSQLRALRPRRVTSVRMRSLTPVFINDGQTHAERLADIGFLP